MSLNSETCISLLGLNVRFLIKKVFSLEGDSLKDKVYSRAVVKKAWRSHLINLPKINRQMEFVKELKHYPRISCSNENICMFGLRLQQKGR